MCELGRYQASPRSVLALYRDDSEHHQPPCTIGGKTPFSPGEPLGPPAYACWFFYIENSVGASARCLPKVGRRCIGEGYPVVSSRGGAGLHAVVTFCEEVLSADTWRNLELATFV